MGTEPTDDDRSEVNDLVEREVGRGMVALQQRTRRAVAEFGPASPQATKALLVTNSVRDVILKVPPITAYRIMLEAHAVDNPGVELSGSDAALLAALVEYRRTEINLVEAFRNEADQLKRWGAPLWQVFFRARERFGWTEGQLAEQLRVDVMTLRRLAAASLVSPELGVQQAALQQLVVDVDAGVEL